MGRDENLTFAGLIMRPYEVEGREQDMNCFVQSGAKQRGQNGSQCECGKKPELHTSSVIIMQPLALWATSGKSTQKHRRTDKNERNITHI